MRTAIVVLTGRGLDLARRLRAARPDARIYGPSCVVGACGGPPEATLAETFPAGEPGVWGWTGPLRRALPALWRDHEAIVAIMALGIVVRLVAPLARDKRRDPAVVAVDDAGRFAIAVLGGHGAAANSLACAVAEILGALPVVTTASDAHGLPAVDQIGRGLGWAIERAENLTRVAAAVVRAEPVAVLQDAGHPDWWRPFGAWPETFQRASSPEDPALALASAVLVISDRVEPPGLPPERTLVYRPRTLVVGIGCRRGTPCEAIAAHVAGVFAARGLAQGSLAAVATVTLKADEPGLIAFAESRGVPLIAYPPGALADHPGIETPSERVRAKIGIPAVSEPAALRASGASRLLVPKTKGPGVTVAVARRLDDRWPLLGPPGRPPEGSDSEPRSSRSAPRVHQAGSGDGPNAGA